MRKNKSKRVQRFSNEITLVRDRFEAKRRRKWDRFDISEVVPDTRKMR